VMLFRNRAVSRAALSRSLLLTAIAAIYLFTVVALVHRSRCTIEDCPRSPDSSLLHRQANSGNSFSTILSDTVQNATPSSIPKTVASILSITSLIIAPGRISSKCQMSSSQQYAQHTPILLGG
jgi:hypothetical protein